MADLTIRLKTAVDPSGAEQEINKLIEKLNGKNIDLKFNQSKVKTQLNELNQALNNAFKLDGKQLNNLKQIQSTLKEINKLSKDVQKGLFGSGSAKTNTTSTNKELEATKAKYESLKKSAESLQKQMSKTIDTQAYDALDSKLKKVKASMEETAQEMDKVAGKSKIDISRDLIKSFDTIQKKANNTQETINNIFKNKNLTSSQITQLNELQRSIDTIKGKDLAQLLKSKTAYEDMHKLYSEINNVELALKGLNSSITLGNKIDSSINKLNSLQSKLYQMKGSQFADKSGIYDLITQIEKYKSELRSIDPNTESARAEFDDLKNKINQCEIKFKEFETALKSARTNFKFQADFNKVAQDIENLAQKCQRLGISTEQIEIFRSELQRIGQISNLDDRARELEVLIKEMSTFKSTLPTTTGNVNGLSTAIRRTNSFANNLLSTLSMYSLGNMLGMQITKSIHSIGSIIVDTDNAIRQVLKVAPKSFTGTEQQLDSLKRKATEAGQEVARSSIDIINSTAGALQSGFHNVNKAVEYAKNSAMFSNVIDTDQETTDKYLKSILASYGGVAKSLNPVREQIKGATKDYSTMMKVMDMVNYANNNYAVTGADVAEAMMRSASSASTMGMSMEQLTSIIVAGQEPLQNASKLGNGLKTMFANFAGWKTSTKDGSASLNKTAKVLQTMAGINMTDANGQIRDTYEIMDEIGSKWDDLTKKQRTSIGEAVAGKQNINTFNAIMNNWKQAQKYYQQFKDGMTVGSAEKEKQHSPYVEKSA